MSQNERPWETTTLPIPTLYRCDGDCDEEYVHDAGDMVYWKGNEHLAEGWWCLGCVESALDDMGGRFDEEKLAAWTALKGPNLAQEHARRAGFTD